MQHSRVRWETTIGLPITWREYTLAPQARVLRVRLPRGGGLVWNRPSGVVVTRADAPTRTLPVRDVTRMAQVAIALFALLCAALIGFALRSDANQVISRR